MKNNVDIDPEKTYDAVSSCRFYINEMQANNAPSFNSRQRLEEVMFRVIIVLTFMLIFVSFNTVESETGKKLLCFTT